MHSSSLRLFAKETNRQRKCVALLKVHTSEATAKLITKHKTTNCEHKLPVGVAHKLLIVHEKNKNFTLTIHSSKHETTLLQGKKIK